MPEQVVMVGKMSVVHGDLRPRGADVQPTISRLPPVLAATAIIVATVTMRLPFAPPEAGSVQPETLPRR